MKFGIRTASLSKRIAARTSPARFLRHSLGFKAPRGFGWFTNPRRAAYNRMYNRTTIKADNLIILGISLVVMLIGWLASAIFSLFTSKTESKIETAQTSSIPNSLNLLCPRCNLSMVLRNGRRGQFYGCSSFPRCRGTRSV
jgi:hypothetical protein